jgi:hypothetical protein
VVRVRHLSRGNLGQVVILGVALAFWGALGVGGYFGEGVWRVLSGALFVIALAVAVLAFRRARH